MGFSLIFDLESLYCNIWRNSNDTAHFKLMQIDKSERKSVGKRMHAKYYRIVKVILTL